MRLINYKLIVLIFLFILTSEKSNAQFDSIAVAILDSMSENIDQLESASFKFYSEYDISTDRLGLITHSEWGSMTLVGPDKLYLEKKGDKGHKEAFYNGNIFAVYSHDKNQYASTELSLTLIELIDSISRHFNVEFPGVDVFYPDFVDNLLENSSELVFIGLTAINDIQCYHIAGVQEEFTYQMWISADQKYLPVKISLDYYRKQDKPRYRIIYTDWKLNEPEDGSKFNFIPPPGSTKIKIATNQ